MKDKQDAREVDRKGKLVQNMESQEYNPFGR